jgi:hypothetical protein
MPWRHACAARGVWGQEWSHRATRCAVIRGARGDPSRTCGTDTTPPSAVRSARRAWSAVPRPASTAAPVAGTDQPPPREESPPQGRTRAEPRHHRCTMPREARPTGCQSVAAVCGHHHPGYSSEALALSRHWRNRARGIQEVYRSCSHTGMLLHRGTMQGPPWMV